MKKVLYTLVSLLFFSLPAIPQVEPGDVCQSGFEWKVNDMIMMFAPGMAINFYDQSKGDVAAWSWDFGDGSFSDEQNPMHIYTFLYGSDGTVSNSDVFVPVVCLTIKTKDGCSSTICKTLNLVTDTIINPEPACYVYFYPYRNDSLVSIPEVAPYSFYVSAPENSVSYFWDFGDGSTSQDANPVHSFDIMSGQYQYNVCLSIMTADSCINSYCSPVYVRDPGTDPNCQAAYTYVIMESYPLQFGFQDLSKGNATGWFWDFGDGTYSSEQNPVHMFGYVKDSLFSNGFVAPPVDDYYKVCLTVVTADNCKSTYCDYVYSGGIIDTIYPQPCPYYISVTTSSILGGNYCNGTASASLVDAQGNKIEALDFYWSTGESGSSASGLCVNESYYVSITGVDGCQIVGSFAILDYTKPYDQFGYWTIYGNGSFYDLNYAVPDSGYTCNWLFSDGTVMTGENVKYAFDGSYDKSVTLNVVDGSGNVVYTEEIALNQATSVKDTKAHSLKLYPNPAVDNIYIRLNEVAKRDVQVEIYNSLGQKLISQNFTDASSSSEISMSVVSLKRGVYYARIMGVEGNPVTISFVK